MTKTKSILFSVMLLSASHLYAQITNSWSSDKAGMFYYSIDTLMRIISNEKKLDRVYISMENLFMIHVPLPDTIAGIRVITTDHSIKPKVMTENDLFFYNLSLQIDGTYVFVSIVVLEKSRNSFAVYKGGDYHFRYEWQPEQRNYELDLVGEGSMWMEGPGEKGFFKRIFRRNNSPK